jgi:hypothetical protein
VQLSQVGLLGLGLTGEVRLDPLTGIHLDLDANDLLDVCAAWLASAAPRVPNAPPDGGVAMDIPGESVIR